MVLGVPLEHQWLVPKCNLGTPLQAKLLLLRERIIPVLHQVAQAGLGNGGRLSGAGVPARHSLD